MSLAYLVRSYQSLESLDVITSDIPHSIAQGLIEKSWKLIDIVRELGEVLVSEDDKIRSTGETDYNLFLYFKS